MSSPIKRGIWRAHYIYMSAPTTQIRRSLHAQVRRSIFRLMIPQPIFSFNFVRRCRVLLLRQRSQALLLHLLAELDVGGYSGGQWLRQLVGHLLLFLATHRLVHGLWLYGDLGDDLDLSWRFGRRRRHLLAKERDVFDVFEFGGVAKESKKK